MQYVKVVYDETVIEFHNNWLGEETVIVNGQLVSKKSSVWGISHYFTALEHGHTARYVLTTRVDPNMRVVIDLSRNGQMLHNGLHVPYGTRPRKPKNTHKKQGLAFLKKYDLKDALAALEKALEIDPKDPEIHFHMACAYSVLEQTAKGFEALKNAIQYGLSDKEVILNHEMLAFIRLHDSFESFLNSGFVEYDVEAVQKSDDEETDHET